MRAFGSFWASEAKSPKKDVIIRGWSWAVFQFWAEAGGSQGTFGVPFSLDTVLKSSWHPYYSVQSH
jgi:hypothetical protein